MVKAWMILAGELPSIVGFECEIFEKAEAQGISEINPRLRSDQALQRAFGRTGCAEQSVVQETLDACTPTNVAQLMQALNLIFQKQGLASRHDFSNRMLLLDIDMSGLPCGKCRKRPPGAIKVRAAPTGADN